jgi:polysaccharide pyruvyl transferase WcaK-like protein
MNKNIRVALQGWNGKKNIGDDAMTTVILQKLAQTGQRYVVSLIADKPALPQFGLNDQTVSIDCIHQSQMLTRLKLMRKLIRTRNANQLSENRDLYILGGGSIYQNAAVINQTLSNIHKARKSNPAVKIITLGVSFGPFTTKADEKAAQALSKEFDFVGLRDVRSAELLVQLNPVAKYVVAPDIALLLPQLLPLDSVDQKNDIGISLRANHTDDHTIKTCVQLVEAHIKDRPDARIRFFQFCALPKDDDLSLLSRFTALLPQHLHSRIDVVAYSSQPLQSYYEIAACAHMICVRLHAAVISYAVKTPFTVLPYHSKCVDFAHTVHAPQTVYQPALSATDNLQLAQNPQIFEKHKVICQTADRHFDWLK